MLFGKYWVVSFLKYSVGSFELRIKKNRSSVQDDVNFANYLVSVVCPCSKLHEALLHIERKVLHINRTVAFVDDGRLPYYLACVVHCRFCHQRHNELSVRAENKTTFFNITSEAPGFSSSFQRCMNVHLGTILLVL